MKKMILILGVIFSSVAVSAQAINQQPATNDSITSVRLEELEEKLNRQEAQLKAIQRENQQLKNETPSSDKPEARRKRFSVSRQGSKQLVRE
jgi:hypothetical protein